MMKGTPVRIAIVYYPGAKAKPIWFELNRKQHKIARTTYYWKDRVGDAPLLHWAVVTEEDALTGLDEATILSHVKSGKLPARQVNSNSYSTLLSITPDAIWELITGRSKPVVKPSNELHYTRYGAIPIVRLNSALA